MRYEISWWQLTMLFVSVNLSVLVSYAPVVTGKLPPVRDAWLAALLAAAVGGVLTFVAYALIIRFQGKHMYEMIRIVLGRFLGSAVVVAFVAYFIHWATVITREFALFMDSVVYLRTPDIVFVIIFVILGLVGASQQIEFIGRTAELAGGLVIAGALFLIVATFPFMDPGMLRPFLAEGWPPVLEQAITPAAVFAEGVWVVLLAAPYLNNMRDGSKAIGLGLGLNALFGSLSAAVMIGIFGPELISIIAFVPLTAARLIEIGDVMERLEWILLLLWFGSMGVKVSLLMFGARLGLSTLFPRWSINTSLFLITGAVFAWSFFVFPTLTEILRFFDPVRLVPQLAVPLVLPVVLWAVAKLRKLKTKEEPTEATN